MGDPCNCDQALELTDILRKIATGGYVRDSARVAARNVLEKWSDEITITIQRTQDITVCINSAVDDVTAIDEEGNKVFLTPEEFDHVLKLRNAGIDETSR